MQIERWESYLLKARGSELEPEVANGHYRLALLLAQDRGGRDSALAGIVLLDFQDYLERQGREMEAAAAQESIRRILSRYWQGLGRSRRP